MKLELEPVKKYWASVTSSNPKYNGVYLDNIIKTKYIPKLEEMLNERK